MLQSIYIQNYALIDTLDISFTPGFSVIKIGRASCRERVFLRV